MMTTKHNLFLITSRQEFINEVERVVAGLPSARISGRGTPAEVLSVDCNGATAFILDLGISNGAGLETMRQFCQQKSEAQVIVAGPSRDPDLILNAIRAGAVDFLQSPFDQQSLSDALDRVRHRPTAEAEPVERSGRIISFVSAKGGCGATTMAVNLGVELCERSPKGRKRSVIVLDLDYPGGDVSAILRLKPSYNLADVATNIHRLDIDLLKSMAARHESGLMFLASAGEGDRPGWLTAEQMAVIISFLRKHFDDVILAGGGLGEIERAGIDQAHVVHLVTTLDFLSLKRAQGMLKRLRELGVASEALRIVVNGREPKASLSPRDAKEALALPIVWSIPHDAKTAMRAATAGVPFVLGGRSRLRAAVREYATRLIAEESGVKKSTRGLSGLFKRATPRRADAAA